MNYSGNIQLSVSVVKSDIRESCKAIFVEVTGLCVQWCCLTKDGLTLSAVLCLGSYNGTVYSYLFVNVD